MSMSANGTVVFTYYSPHHGDVVAKEEELGSCEPADVLAQLDRFLEAFLDLAKAEHWARVT